MCREGQNQTAWSLLTSDEQPDTALSAESITYELEIAKLQWERQNQAQVNLEFFMYAIFELHTGDSQPGASY